MNDIQVNEKILDTIGKLGNSGIYAKRLDAFCELVGCQDRKKVEQSLRDLGYPIEHDFAWFTVING